MPRPTRTSLQNRCCNCATSITWILDQLRRFYWRYSFHLNLHPAGLYPASFLKAK